MSEVEKLLDAKAELGEGPVWDSENGEVLWVDIMKGEINRVDLVGNTKEPNPELTSWASENMSAWESFVNSLPNEKPQKSDYPEDEQGLDQQYGEDLRFYNKVVRDLKRQLPKIQKLVKDKE